jgi:dUTP pyrophosphatase
MNIDIKVSSPMLTPVRAHPSDAGADLKCTSDYVLMPGQHSSMLDTGVAVKIPVGYVGLVFSRSSQGVTGVRLANSVGVIDSDYRGNIKVILANDGTVPYKIEAGSTKIAQLVIVPIVLANFIVQNDSDWNNTVRGVNGFGSTN